MASRTAERRALAPGVVEVWFTPVNGLIPLERSASYLPLLDAGERACHDAFRFDGDRHLYRVSHALLRRTLSRYDALPPESWRFELGAFGRPRIAGANIKRLSFSLTHTKGLA